MIRKPIVILAFLSLLVCLSPARAEGSKGLTSEGVSESQTVPENESKPNAKTHAIELRAGVFGLRSREVEAEKWTTLAGYSLRAGWGNTEASESMQMAGGLEFLQTEQRSASTGNLSVQNEQYDLLAWGELRSRPRASLQGFAVAGFGGTVTKVRTEFASKSETHYGQPSPLGTAGAGIRYIRAANGFTASLEARYRWAGLRRSEELTPLFMLALGVNL